MRGSSGNRRGKLSKYFREMGSGDDSHMTILERCVFSMEMILFNLYRIHIICRFSVKGIEISQYKVLFHLKAELGTRPY